MIPKFWELVKETDEASDAVDNFDLHSEDAGSVAEFRKLESHQQAAAIALVELVASYATQLKTSLNA